MITTERKSKYKIKVTFTDDRPDRNELHNWLLNTLGEGGRSKHLRWRYGWTNREETYYFKHHEDATLFVMRWA